MVLSHASGTATVPTTSSAAAANLPRASTSSSEGQANATQAIVTTTANDSQTVTNGAERSGTAVASQVPTLAKRLR